MTPLQDFFQKFTGVTVYALVGASGTGKSFRAKLLAQKYGISAIIDDGLLIQGDKILGGHSAKREKTYMGAVRVALFDDKEHRDEIARILHKSHIKKILLIDTYEKMVIKIATRLQLPPPEKIIKIEDIATREEIEKATRSRQIEGKHVIPVPANEIKKSYPQIFHDSVRVFLSKGNRVVSNNDSKLFEKSVVTPEFSKKGRVEISEAALCQKVLLCVNEFDPAIRVKKLAIKTDSHGYRLIITIDITIGTQLTGKIQNLQQHVIDSIERNTAILIEEVSIIIDQMRPKQTEKPN